MGSEKWLLTHLLDMENDFQNVWSCLVRCMVVDKSFFFCHPSAVAKAAYTLIDPQGVLLEVWPHEILNEASFW